MKIPKYMYEPVPGINRYGLDMARKALEIEARTYRQNGQLQAARALLNSARMLKRVSDDGQSFAVAFDFPTQDSASGSQHE